MWTPLRLNKVHIQGARILVLVLPMIALRGCGSADEKELGRCKPVPAAKYVAAASDTDGKPWKFDLKPDTSVTLKCYNTATTGKVMFVGVIRDSLDSAKAGLVTKPVLAGETSELNVIAKESDANTDSCGVVTFTIQWKCPEPRKTSSGFFYAFSGPLLSNSISVAIEHYVEVVTTNGPAPAIPVTNP